MSVLDLTTGIRFANALIHEIETSKTGWRLERERLYRQALELWNAIRESDARKLAPSWWWEEPDHRRKAYLVDPLGERIPAVWSDLLFRGEPTIGAINKGDQEKLDDWVEFNELASQLKWAEEVCSSEGEVWWRIISIPGFGHALTEWHSRLNVIPYWVGRKCVAVAFVSILAEDRDANEETVYIEVHSHGVTLNRLYHGKKLHSLAGARIPLDSNPETAGIPEEWVHNLRPLAGRIPNKLGRDWRYGISDYAGIASLLLALNETLNIGQENLHLTGKQKVVIPERFLDIRGQLPKGAEVIIATEVDQDPDKIKNEFAQIQWEFDAEGIIKWQDSLELRALTRARVAPQLLGKGVEGASTGPSLRARLTDSLMAAEGKGKFWDDSMPDVILRNMEVENLPGIGKDWGLPDKKKPHFKRADPVPADPEATSRTVVMEVNTNVLSRKTAIQRNNPEWSDERVTEELAEIRKERDLMLKSTAAPDGNQRIPDPAGGIPREPGNEDPTAVPDPRARTTG
jgi:hypothetical protein